MNATSGKWHCVVWHVGYPRAYMIFPIQYEARLEERKKERTKERKNNFILFIG